MKQNSRKATHKSWYLQWELIFHDRVVENLRGHFRKRSPLRRPLGCCTVLFNYGDPGQLLLLPIVKFMEERVEPSFSELQVGNEV